MRVVVLLSLLALGCSPLNSGGALAPTGQTMPDFVPELVTHQNGDLTIRVQIRNAGAGILYFDRAVGYSCQSGGAPVFEADSHAERLHMSGPEKYGPEQAGVTEFHWSKAMFTAGRVWIVVSLHRETDPRDLFVASYGVDYGRDC